MQHQSYFINQSTVAVNIYYIYYILIYMNIYICACDRFQRSLCIIDNIKHILFTLRHGGYGLHIKIEFCVSHSIPHAEKHRFSRILPNNPVHSIHSIAWLPYFQCTQIIQSCACLHFSFLSVYSIDIVVTISLLLFLLFFYSLLLRPPSNRVCTCAA